MTISTYDHWRKSRKKLLGLLCISEELYEDIVNDKGKYYYTFQKRTKNKIRTITDTKEPLKEIQARILKMILAKFNFPEFLHGGIKKKSNITNARVHRKSKIIICIDIKNCFPSITQSIIKNMFKCAFRCSRQVSNILSELTTLNGVLPQGTKTSNHIANVVLLRGEERQVEQFKMIGWRYTRFVDDIALSKEIEYSNGEISEIISKIISRLGSIGLKISRDKLKIDIKAEDKIITGCHVGNTIMPSKEIIDDCYEMLMNLEGGIKKGVFDQKKYIKLKGKISYISSFGNSENLDKLKKKISRMTRRQ